MTSYDWTKSFTQTLISYASRNHREHYSNFFITRFKTSLSLSLTTYSSSFWGTPYIFSGSTVTSAANPGSVQSCPFWCPWSILVSFPNLLAPSSSSYFRSQTLLWHSCGLLKFSYHPGISSTNPAEELTAHKPFLFQSLPTTVLEVPRLTRKWRALW